MAETLPPDFREFLRSLNDHGVKYLLIGGYAVGYHGYPRATNDIDVWIELSKENAVRIAAALRYFGFDMPEIQPALFQTKKKIIRMGVPPVQIEICMEISGVEFTDCYRRKIAGTIDDIDIPIISLEDLKKNKKASGRYKDLADLDYLP